MIDWTAKKVHVYRIILRLVLNKIHVMKKQSPEIILIKSNCMATSLVNGTLFRPFVIWPIWNWLNLLSILTNHWFTEEIHTRSVKF